MRTCPIKAMDLAVTDLPDQVLSPRNVTHILSRPRLRNSQIALVLVGESSRGRQVSTCARVVPDVPGRLGSKVAAPAELTSFFIFLPDDVSFKNVFILLIISVPAD